MIKQSQKVTFKLSQVDLITLDSHAESEGMNRSEFIKYCINQEMEKAKNEAAANAKLNDFERLMQTLVDINSTAIGTKQAAIRGLLQIQRAMLELYPDNKEIEKIFYGEK